MKVEFIRPTIPAEARQACAEPVETPDRRLSAKEVGSLWNRDRTSLEICEQRRKAAVSAVDRAR